MNKIFNLTILPISIILCSLYIAFNPIDFHCDSATFYNYGSQISNLLSHILKKYFFFIFLLFLFCLIIFKKFNLNKYYFFFIFTLATTILVFAYFQIKTPFSILSFARPPGYPIFMYMTGVYFFDTFYLLIFFQAIISVSCIYFFYAILKILTNNIFSLITTLIYSLTSIPYILITFIGAEQLLFFFSMFFIYCLKKYDKSKKIKYLYIGSIVSVLGWLTRWEGQILFYIFLVYIIFNFITQNDKVSFIKDISKIFIIPIIILLTWTGTKSISTKNYSEILSVTGVTYDQFFWKFYSVIPHELYFYEKNLNVLKKNSGKFNIEIYPGHAPSTLVVLPENGLYSKKYFDEIYLYLKNNPKSYKQLKKPLDESFSPNINLYDSLFEKFNGSVDKIHKNMINQPNIFYFNFINAALNKTIGKKTKDEIYKNSILEAFQKNPLILMIYFSDYLQAYGIDINPFIEKKIIPYSNVTNRSYFTPVDGGKCGLNNLTKKTYDEYITSQSIKKNFYINSADKINDFIRNYFGILILFSILFLFFSNFKTMFPIIFTSVFYDIVTSIAVGPPANTKYEVTSFSLNLIILSFFIYNLYNKIKKRNA